MPVNKDEPKKEEGKEEKPKPKEGVKKTEVRQRDKSEEARKTKTGITPTRTGAAKKAEPKAAKDEKEKETKTKDDKSETKEKPESGKKEIGKAKGEETKVGDKTKEKPKPETAKTTAKPKEDTSKEKETPKVDAGKTKPKEEAGKTKEKPKEDTSKAKEKTKEEVGKAKEKPTKEEVSKTKENPKDEPSKTKEKPKDEASKTKEKPKEPASKTKEKPKEEPAKTKKAPSGEEKGKVKEEAKPTDKESETDEKSKPTEEAEKPKEKEKEPSKAKQIAADGKTKDKPSTGVIKAKVVVKKPKDEEAIKKKEVKEKKTPRTSAAKGGKQILEKNGTAVEKSPSGEEIKMDGSTEEGRKGDDETATEEVKLTVAQETEETPLQGMSSKFKGLNCRLVFAVAAAAFGSAFQHGYNLGVINAPLQLMGDWLNSTSENRTGEYLTETGETMIVSAIVSIYCIGGMIGGAFTGFFSERFGRKGGLLLNNIFAVIAAFLFGLCKVASSWEMIIIGRFIIGINNGLNAGLAPMYLSEIAPTNLRGAIGTVYQLVVTISILFSQIMGLDTILGTEHLWPLLLALTFTPAIFQLCTLPICPESPKFLLINKEQRLEAQRALTWLRNSSSVEEDLEEIQNEAEAQKLVPKVSVREIVTNPALRIPLLISIMMMLAQQFSGINAAIFFSVKIYESAGLNEDESLYATIAMGTMNVLMTVISLILVEKAGRKTLMVIGLSGMLVDTLLLTLCLALQSESARWLSYASIVLVILFVVMFATGPGSIPWFIVTELFASNARPTACSIAVAVNWAAAFFVGVLFLPIQQVLDAYVFLVFTVLLGLFIAFVVKKVPETKGRTIDEITALFKQQAYGAENRV